MANPVFIDLTKDTWTKVATAVTSGIVHKIKSQPYNYLQTYRLTGEAAPTDKADGVRVFENDIDFVEIAATVPIDVYLYPVNADGRIRVDV